MLLRICLLVVIIFSSYIYAEQNLSELLNVYKSESELSKITKKESAGFIDIYTRDELEKMQVHNLLDVLKTLSSIYLTRGINNVSLLGKPTIEKTPVTSVRLYINDHDMSSSSFGSAFMIWGEMPIEYIDHIELYKATSSIEFGNETASFVIKLYTKTAEREEGGKIRIMADNAGSYDVNAYFAQNLENGLSYFAYVNSDDINRDVYHNTYENNIYEYNSDKSGHNFYANFSYSKWILELGHYRKQNDNFLGIGIHRTPTGGDLKSRHSYIHLSKLFDNNIKIQLSYDDLSYDRVYVDDYGIKASNITQLIKDYDLKFDDKIFSAILEKKFIFDKHQLLFGGFYKNKSFYENADLRNDDLSFTYKASSSNSLNLYSLYLEENYDFNENTRFVASIKGDFFRYQKDVKSQNELVARLGMIKNINDIQFKAFLIKSYNPNAFYQLYNPDATPYISNPNLDTTKMYIFSTSLRYKNEHNEIELIYAGNELHDRVVYNPILSVKYENASDVYKYTRYQFKYSYIYNYENRFNFSIFTGDNSLGIENSPRYGADIKFFNTYKKFDIYNEFILRSSYSLYGIDVDPSCDYTAAIKYNVSTDFSLGIRGENIFNSGYKQAYRLIPYAIPVVDQKFWINMEYLF